MKPESKQSAARLREAKAHYQRGYDDGLRQTVVSADFVPSAYVSARDALASAGQILGRDDGWLRLAPADAGKTVYVKYKFNSGIWAGHYTMYVGTSFPSLSDLVTGIFDKLNDVDARRLRPSKDKYHS